MGRKIVQEDKRERAKDDVDYNEIKRKEELGRATWTFLHSFAAALPVERGSMTRQQKRDATEIVKLMARVYPCKECASHWAEIIKSVQI